MPHSQSSDRRRFPRVIAVRSCKVRPPRSTRYLPAETADVSGGGALVRLGAEHRLAPGDTVDVAVAWNDEAVLSDDSVRRAIIRRVLVTEGGQQAVGVEFDMPQRLPDAVMPPLAA